MSNLICSIDGARGRKIDIYDNKCVITTDVTIGSVLTNNATDGEKTIFYKDCIGLQFKEPGITIGFLQIETATGQMNNLASNFFAENTFTFETQTDLVREVYHYISTRVEGYKYDDEDLLMKELPSRLASIYGAKRPLTNKEKKQKDMEMKAKKEAAEKKQAEERASRIQAVTTKFAEGYVDNRVTDFMNNASFCNRFMAVYTEWKKQGLDADPFFIEITKDLQHRADIERMYGPSKTKIDAQIRKICSKELDFC